MKKISFVLVSLLMTACASNTGNVAPIVSNERSSATSNAGTSGLSSTQLETRGLSAEDAAVMQGLQNQSVYFDLNDFSVKDQYLNVIQKQADFIKSHRNDVVTLEGNSDERGSNEFNLALGDKRANAVRSSLEVLGVTDRQINTVSFGEEKPRLSCHEEKCWSENRRVDFKYKLGQ